MSAAILKSSLSLMALALIAALLLTAGWQLTQDKIAYQQHDTERQTLNDIFPSELHDNDLTATRLPLDANSPGYEQLALLGLTSQRTAFVATLQGKPSGVVLPLETAQGYRGAIVLLVGIDSNGNITGVRAQQHAETPGLGDKLDIQQSLWITSFNHRSLDDTPEVLWHVKKDGGDFDQFVGATITPRAVVAAVHNVLLFFDANKDKLLALPTGSGQR